MLRVITFVLVLHAASASAQIVSITKFYHNGKEMEMVRHSVRYFSFHEFDIRLTDDAKKYLDAFGKYYRDSLLSKRRYIIDLTPGMSHAEQGQNESLGFTRAKVVVNYLKENYGIGDRNFKIRVHETTTISCVGYIFTERHPKRAARRERRKFESENLDEDSYFKDRS